MGRYGLWRNEGRRRRGNGIDKGGRNGIAGKEDVAEERGSGKFLEEMKEKGDTEERDEMEEGEIGERSKGWNRGM